MLNDESCVRFFCMTRAARALEIACDNRKQTLYRLNRPKMFSWDDPKLVTSSHRSDSTEDSLKAGLKIRVYLPAKGIGTSRCLTWLLGTPTDVVKFELLKLQVELLSIERFSIECRKTKTKAIALTAEANNAMNESEFAANSCNRRQAWENVYERGTIVVFFFFFCLASLWLKTWGEFCQPIKERSKTNQCKRELLLKLNRKPLYLKCIWHKICY